MVKDLIFKDMSMVLQLRLLDNTHGMTVRTVVCQQSQETWALI